jgi:hypothetical protein
MSVFLDVNGATGTGFFNLLTISGEDGALDLNDFPGDATVFVINYVETAGQPATADRLSDLVNDNFPSPITTTSKIVVTALNGGNDPHSGIDVTGNGITYLDSTGSSPVIRIAYDISQCCGAGLALFDINGNHITDPNPVILYHELSHAFRKATGTQASNDEIPAETDENVLRSQLGLCLRDVNNHDGDCTGGDDCGGSTGNADGGPLPGGCASSDDGGCFIVSTTTGSATSIEVTELRQLRDRVASASRLAAQLIEVIYQDYYQFSPGIAANLEQQPIARQAVLGIVVRPLLAWYKLAGLLALEQPDEATVMQARQQLLSACPTYFGASSISVLLETVRSGQSFPPGSPQLLRDFAPLFSPATRLPFASWAILDPLERVWRTAANHLDVVDQVAQWLATAPLETLSPPGDPESLEAELAGLAAFFNFQPIARRQIGVRLASAWPQACGALERYGFIDKEVFK